MPASPVKHQYHGSGKTFFIVTCEECLVALNSGHHYQAGEHHLAQQEADDHNAAHHPTT